MMVALYSDAFIMQLLVSSIIIPSILHGAIAMTLPAAWSNALR